jgi:hypothetical protein
MSEIMPGLIGRAFDQLCFVVEDLDAAIGYWRRVNGVERWSKAYDLAKDSRTGIRVRSAGRSPRCSNRSGSPTASDSTTRSSARTI